MAQNLKRLPDAGRSLGNGIREFKRSIGGEEPEPDLLPAAEAQAAGRAD